jgi:Predicted hydrolases or acyltransferases (alpha/beta hydrolase superfamily)
MEGRAQVNGVELWYQVSGEGEPVIQIHGAGFGHFNFAPATPAIAEHFRVIDYDLRGYGQSERPVQHYDMEVWADDVAGLLDALELPAAHVHGTSMGGMIAIVFAGKYPGADDLGRDQLRGREAGDGRPPDLQELDRHRADGPDGPGQPHPRRADRVAGALEGVPGDTGRRSPRSTTSSRSCATRTGSRCSRPLRGDVRHGPPRWLPKITSPALVLGGDEDLMTPWDQGPDGAGQQAIFEGIVGAEKHVVHGPNHSTIFDNTDEHVRVVIDFFRRNSAA